MNETIERTRTNVSTNRYKETAYENKRKNITLTLICWRRWENITSCLIDFGESMGRSFSFRNANSASKFSKTKLKIKKRHSSKLTEDETVERITQMIQSLSVQELMQLEQDINNSNSYLKNIVQKEIQSRETSNCKTCAHCGADINDVHAHNFTMTFGPNDFRKKATLCGMDCLQSFIRYLKSIDDKRMIESREMESEEIDIAQSRRQI